MDNLDEYDFTPSSNTNLASLFDSNATSEPPSLTYTAPKQPKALSEVKTEPPKTESSVILAQVVQVWKLTDQKYIGIGKHGLAIIGSSTQNTYEMILYKEKKNVIMRVRICDNFEIFIKKDYFISFFDNLKNNWLIKFNAKEDCDSITKQLEKLGAKINNEIELVTEKKVNYEDNTESKAKADILTRIARMGQSILPNTDSEINISDSQSIKSADITPHYPHNEIKKIDSPTTIIPHIQNIPSPYIIGQPVTYDPLNIYLTENRSNNTEMRMNLAQITDKLNHIMKCVEEGKPSTNPNCDVLKSRIKVLDLRIENLSKDLSATQAENVKLKEQINQRGELQKSIEEFQSQRELQNIKIFEYEQRIQSYEENIHQLSETLTQQKHEAEELKQQWASPQQKEDMAKTITDLQLKLQKLEERHSSKSKIIEQSLKELMNGMYCQMKDSFHEDKNYKGSEINGIIAQIIKQTTLKVIENITSV